MTRTVICTIVEHLFRLIRSSSVVSLSSLRCAFADPPPPVVSSLFLPSSVHFSFAAPLLHLLRIVVVLSVPSLSICRPFAVPSLSLRCFLLVPSLLRPCPFGVPPQTFSVVHSLSHRCPFDVFGVPPSPRRSASDARSVSHRFPPSYLRRPFGVPSLFIRRPFDVPSISIRCPFLVPSVSLRCPFGVSSLSTNVDSSLSLRRVFVVTPTCHR